MITAVVPAIVAIIGLLLYAMAASKKTQAVGLILFAIGAFVSVTLLASHSVRLP